MRVLLRSDAVIGQRFGHRLDSQSGQLAPARREVVGRARVLDDQLQRLAIDQEAIGSAHRQLRFAGAQGGIGAIDVRRVAQINLVDILADRAGIDAVELGITLDHQKAGGTQGHDFRIGQARCVLLVKILRHGAALDIDRDDAREVDAAHLLGGVVQVRLHDAHQRLAVGRDGQPLHAPIGPARGQLRRQHAARLVAGVCGERVDALDFLACGVKVHDVRTVFIADPERPVLQRHQPLRIESAFIEPLDAIAIGVQRDDAAIEVVRCFARAAKALVGQAGDRAALGVLEQNGVHQFGLALAGQPEQANARRVAGREENDAGRRSAGFGGRVRPTVAQAIEIALAGRVRCHGGAVAAIANFGFFGVVHLAHQLIGQGRACRTRPLEAIAGAAAGGQAQTQGKQRGNKGDGRFHGDRMNR